ncbi:MAG: hypothetical protein GPJ54_17205 [Candidatus Heimdallarchaeota archaeon]|nr:hypothetical protein [Candidatus Heimdallarchaeota archaeon]
MGLDPLEVDNSSDKDNDGLTNLFEWEYTGNYTHGLNASNPDTDGDGMIDGWEVENDLDPLKNDAHEDPDNDFLPNDFEHEYGLDPNNQRELYVMLIMIILIISTISYMLLRIRDINNQAKKENFTNMWDKRKSLKAGFETQIERSEAQKLGFLTKEVRDIIVATGLKNANIMKDTWVKRNTDILNDVDKFDLDIAISKILQTESPRELLIVQNEFGNILAMLKENNIKLNNQIALQDTLLNLIDRGNSNLMVGISRDYIENIRHTSNETSHKMHGVIRSFEKEIENRKEWFQPWEALLTLIQITPDEKPISISEIMQVINRSEEHAEDLLIALLKENTKIGSYNNQTKSYTKASNIDRYLEIALAQMKDPDESLKE